MLQATGGDLHAKGQCSPQQPTPVILLGVFLGLPVDTALQRPAAVSANGGVALGDLGVLMLLLGTSYNIGPLWASGIQSRPFHKPGVGGTLCVFSDDSPWLVGKGPPGKFHFSLDS